ncbi:flagellar hook-basal body complex protein FliE [Sanguibacter suaedae]|jgi:flagellar hook-basal body complex protein FliE|uniref:Flagellar hook-basal body complex protein FliE n=1 Tax=Sanguibacter suaedae TaxID=2795737 RepID=A0A934IB66_9MICO|nr:flagellar hook-basal body complex protein FliE [Sanguibacter suaedae]MBI9114570.1 flagellar hook-basal body complex protein FliE [Sanguibacter suaedae]
MMIPALDGISAIGAAGAVTPTGYVRPGEGTAPTSDVSGAFGSILSGAVDNLDGLQRTSNELAVRAVTGDLDDVHDYTIASSQAKATLELTAAVRNKAVDAFTEIMRMQA